MSEDIKDYLLQFYNYCQEHGYEMQGVKKGLLADDVVTFVIKETEPQNDKINE